MKILKLIAILFFDLIDKHYHQRRIINFIKGQNFDVKIFLDIGSHKGTYTDLILNNFQNCKSYLFEPQKHIFKFLKKKYKKKKNIYIFNYALSNKRSIQTLNINQHDLTSSLSKFDEKNSYLKIKAKLFSTTSKKMIYKKEKVKTQKLVNLLKSRKIKNIDLLKIDTEGHEFQVLKGLNNEIKKVRYILIEFHNDEIYLNYKPKKIHDYLINNDFILKSTYKFPFTTWEDRFYINAKYQ